MSAQIPKVRRLDQPTKFAALDSERAIAAEFGDFGPWHFVEMLVVSSDDMH